jgi:hypothetical protein
VWANAWINENRNGTKYMKIKLKPKQEPIPTGPIKDIILGSFVNNAEGRARHCYENFVIQNLNGNFRSHESGQVHVCPAF